MISTSLVLPAVASTPDSGSQDQATLLGPGPYSAQPDLWGFSSDTERIVVRIEVKDTGWGISSRDIEATKLFCKWMFLTFEIPTDGDVLAAFNQTERGRLQG